jgi:hypothetical protein
MGRPHRAAEGGYVYHVLNRANAPVATFENEADYEAFERVLIQAVERAQTRLLARGRQKIKTKVPDTSDTSQGQQSGSHFRGRNPGYRWFQASGSRFAIAATLDRDMYG